MLCQFAQDFPKVAGTFLDRAATLGRSFREETLTDVLMGALVAFKPLGIEILFPNEQKTGADMEWLFVRADGSSYFRLLIQAKKLDGTGKVWTRRSYPEIFHRVHSTGALQSETLVDEALRSGSTYPLYIFYTHQSVCDLAARDYQTLEGVSLVSGTFINALVKKKVGGKIGATHASSLGAIQPKMFPLSRLLCGGVVRRTGMRIPEDVLHFLSDRPLMPVPGLPTPDQVRAALVEAVGRDQDIPRDIPPVGDRLPERWEELSRDPGRFRVIFRSPSRDDERSVEGLG
jgi:hypothetical protein